MSTAEQVSQEKCFFFFYLGWDGDIFARVAICTVKAVTASFNITMSVCFFPIVRTEKVNRSGASVAVYTQKECICVEMAPAHDRKTYMYGLVFLFVCLFVLSEN